jgi:uncharacterized protein YodC (DUF2158 family)
MPNHDLRSLEMGRRARLNSGGHEMTVGVTEGDEVSCVWSDGKGAIRRGTFNRQQLTECEPLVTPGYIIIIRHESDGWRSPAQGSLFLRPESS